MMRDRNLKSKPWTCRDDNTGLQLADVNVKCMRGQKCTDYNSEFNMGNWPDCQAGWSENCGTQCHKDNCNLVGGKWSWG